MNNWVNKGSVQTMGSIGRKVLTTETALGAAYVRVKFSITGAGKAIVRANLSLSTQ